MKVRLKEFKDTDAIIVIECQCGNRRMLNEMDNSIREEIYVNRFGTREKRLRCAQPETMAQRRIGQRKTQCHEHYRVTLRTEVEPRVIEVVHLSHESNETTLEVESIKFPPKKFGKTEGMYPPDPHPYVGNPYEIPAPGPAARGN